MTSQDYLYLMNFYIAITEKLHFKLAQIKHYTWISLNTIYECINVLKNEIDIHENTKFEMTISNKYNDRIETENDEKLIELKNLTLYGRLDIIDDKTIYELKCVNNLTLENLLNGYSEFQCNIKTFAKIIRIFKDKDNKINYNDLKNFIIKHKIYPKNNTYYI